MMYKLEQFADKWAVKDTETNEYFDFTDDIDGKGLHFWWDIDDWCFVDCKIDYDTALAKLKELGGGVEEITSQNTEIEENTMSEYKNAGIKSKKELAQRLIDGEVFYYKGDEIHYNDSLTGDNPFRFNDECMHGVWEDFKEFKTKTEWYEKLDGETPILCFVDDENDLSSKNYVEWIYEHNPDLDNPFATGNVSDCSYTYATPVTKEDLL